MFGFSAYSEVPFSQSVTSVSALVALANAGASSTLTINAFASVDAEATASMLSTLANTSLAVFPSVIGKASTNIDAATSAITSNLFTVDADANFNLPASAASVSVNTLFEVKGAADVDITKVTATPSVDTFSYKLTANPILGSINSSIVSQTLDISVDNTITISSIEATLSENAFTNVRGSANIDISPVEAFLDYNTGSYKVSALKVIDSIFADISTQLPDRPTAIQFDYQAIADQYSRSRTLYIIGQDLNRKAHIASENYTVYIDKENVDYSVYIAPENFTIYIDRDRQDYTVYIAA